MFTPEIAKKASSLLNATVEEHLKMLFDDLISQRTARIKANAPDLELRIVAVEMELLTKLKNYRKSLEDAINRHGS